MSRKKILWLCSWYPNRAEPFHGDFIQRQARAVAIYHHVHVLFVAKITGKTKGEKWKEEKNTSGNLTEHIVYNHSPAFPFGKFFSLIRYYLLNRKYIRQYIKELGKPDFVHVQIPVKAGMVALWMKWRYKIPYVLTEHYGIYNRVVVDPYEDRPFLFRYFTKKIIQQASHFLPVSKQIGETISQVVTPTRFQAIPNTVDTNLFYYEPPRSTSPFRFLHVSNMIPLKNVEGIINATGKLWKQRQDFEVNITGPISPAVFQHAELSGLLGKAIFFTGEVAYEEVARQMKAAHAMVLFSRTENMPCVVLESLCCGRPVISTAVGGVPELLHDSNGIMIEADDEKGLVSAMQDMITKYGSYNQQLIAYTAAELYSYKAIGKKISEVYEKG